MKFTNPRIHATFTNWPLGGNRRGVCVFHVEHNVKKGFRFTRTTTGKPKLKTYGGRAAIVDGDDGRTYLIQDQGWRISISTSDFMDYTGPHMEQAELKALIDEAYKGIIKFPVLTSALENPAVNADLANRLEQARNIIG